MITWNMILGTEDHKKVLAEMYDEMSKEELTMQLGVSETALNAKFRKEGLRWRPSGKRSREIGRGKKKS